MLNLYLWTTPNGRKPLIMLEELGVEYNMIPVRLNGEQKKPEYIAINPNGRIPSLVDQPDDGGEPITVFESGAILIYLAEKFGKFLASEEPIRSTTMQWVMFQMGGIGPMFGQVGHFRGAPEHIPYAINRYLKESQRLYGVLEIRLAQAEYLAGDEYTIADMITYPWVYNLKKYEIDPVEFPNVKRWVDLVGSRPAVEKAMGITLS